MGSGFNGILADTPLSMTSGSPECTMASRSAMDSDEDPSGVHDWAECRAAVRDGVAIEAPRGGRHLVTSALRMLIEGLSPDP